MHEVDSLAYNSKIATIPASEKILFSMLPLLFCLISSSYILHSTAFILMSVFTIRYSVLNIKQYIHLLTVPAVFIFLGLVTIIFNFGIPTSSILFSLSLFDKSLYVTSQSLLFAFNIFMRALSSISCFYFLILNTPMNNLFSFLQTKKVSPLLITLTELIYRFSFVLFGQLERIRTAQLSRLGYLNFKNGIKSSAEILAMTFESSINKVNNIDIVLQSRCFDGNFNIIADDEPVSNILKTQTILLNTALLILFLLEVIL